MTEKFTSAVPNEKNIADILRDSLMVILTLIFVLLYAAAFTGKLDPLKDNTLLLRLEPIILILTSFYFGRLSLRQNEKNLKEEIARQTQKADAAQFAKEKAQQERESLEERISNAHTTLKLFVSKETNNSANTNSEAIKAAFIILGS